MTQTPSYKSVAELLGAPPAPRGAKDRLISTAIDLFYRLGFNAVGVDRILNDSGVGKTTFYKYFEGKDDLIVAAVERFDQWATAAWSSAVLRQAGHDPRAKIVGYFHVLDQWFHAPDFQGCLFLNVAAEFPNPRDPIHIAGAAHKLRSRETFRDLAIDAGAERPGELADQLTILMEGAIVLRQVCGCDDAAKTAAETVETLLEINLPAAT
ncbi:TetR/AcrR family transcriptional regulator [Blastopirellula marina]|nr:TetR/AcrR family transcriptional regulator [Blastopirellula marina]